MSTSQRPPSDINTKIICLHGQLLHATQIEMRIYGPELMLPCVCSVFVQLSADVVKVRLTQCLRAGQPSCTGSFRAVHLIGPEHHNNLHQSHLRRSSQSALTFDKLTDQTQNSTFHNVLLLVTSLFRFPFFIQSQCMFASDQVAPQN